MDTWRMVSWPPTAMSNATRWRHVACRGYATHMQTYSATSLWLRGLCITLHTSHGWPDMCRQERQCTTADLLLISLQPAVTKKLALKEASQSVQVPLSRCDTSVLPHHSILARSRTKISNYMQQRLFAKWLSLILQQELPLEIIIPKVALMPDTEHIQQGLVPLRTSSVGCELTCGQQ